MMRLEKTFAVSATLVSVLASLRLVADFLGPSSAVLAGIGAAAFAGIASSAGLWFVGRRFIHRYAHYLEYKAQQQSFRAIYSDQIDSDLFNTEVVPSFQDAGVERTKTRMLKLIDRLNLSPGDADAEREFVTRTAADESLSRSQRVELIVRGVAKSAGDVERAAGQRTPDR